MTGIRLAIGWIEQPVVGTGELGPGGTGRSRFALELGELDSPGVVAELAWLTGLVRYEVERYRGRWIDTATDEEVREEDLHARYADAVELGGDVGGGARRVREQDHGSARQAITRACFARTGKRLDAVVNDAPDVGQPYVAAGREGGNRADDRDLGRGRGGDGFHAAWVMGAPRFGKRRAAQGGGC